MSLKLCALLALSAQFHVSLAFHTRPAEAAPAFVPSCPFPGWCRDGSCEPEHRYPGLSGVSSLGGLRSKAPTGRRPGNHLCRLRAAVSEEPGRTRLSATSSEVRPDEKISGPRSIPSYELERMSPSELYELSSALYLRKHEDPLIQEQCLVALTRALELKRDWIFADARLAVGAEANSVLADFQSLDGSSNIGADVSLIKDLFLDCDYTATNVQRRLGVPGAKTPGPLYLKKRVNHNTVPQSWLQPMSNRGFDKLDVLIRVFLLGLAAEPEVFEDVVPEETLAVLLRHGLVTSFQGHIVSNVQIFPLNANAPMEPETESNLLFVTDWPPPCAAGLNEEPVMYIGPDSVGLVNHAPRREGAKVLDLCCGSGVQGIVAAKLYAKSAVCVDLSPRAGRFTRFNAVLNGVQDRIEVHVGDLLNAFQNEDVFDMILANPPFVPVPPQANAEERRYSMFADGGPTGEDILERIVSQGIERLRPGSTICIVTELVNPLDFDKKLLHWTAESRNQLFAAVHFDGQPYSVEEYALFRGGDANTHDWIEHLRTIAASQVARGYIHMLVAENDQKSARSSVTLHPSASESSVWAAMNELAIKESRDICTGLVSKALPSSL